MTKVGEGMVNIGVLFRRKEKAIEAESMMAEQIRGRMPYAQPIIFNATYIGQGSTAGKRAITLRDNAAGEYHNSIFYGWGKGFDVENLASGEDSYARLTNDEIVFEGNIFDQCTAEGLNATSSDLFTISMGSGCSSESDSTEAADNSSSVFQATFDENDNSVASTGINNTIIQGRSFKFNTYYCIIRWLIC